jgi:hypothetical protein
MGFGEPMFQLPSLLGQWFSCNQVSLTLPKERFLSFKVQTSLPKLSIAMKNRKENIR